MARKKIDKREESNKDNLDPSKDEFIQTSMSILDWAVERRKQIGVLLGTALAVWVGLIVYNHMTESKIQDASKVLAEGLEVTIAPVEANDDASAQNKDVLTYKTVEDRAAEAVKKLDKAIRETAQTPVASAAKLAKAAALVEEGKNDEAIRLYKECLNDSSLSVFKESMLSALAVAYEAVGNDDEAQKTYQQLADSSSGRIAMWARLGIAAILHRKGEELDKAETMLKAIVEHISENGEPDRNDYLLVQARDTLLAINPEADVPEIPAGINPMILQQLLQAQQAGGAAQ
ncbi:MAG: tetratricopeptide repeat protein [Deltaproteobacteria bacterium]|nr:tetratricopeptide repeat protein [Deltaproteobacteria bacterium]